MNELSDKIRVSAYLTPVEHGQFLSWCLKQDRRPQAALARLIRETVSTEPVVGTVTSVANRPRVTDEDGVWVGTAGEPGSYLKPSPSRGYADFDPNAMYEKRLRRGLGYEKSLELTREDCDTYEVTQWEPPDILPEWMAEGRAYLAAQSQNTEGSEL